jgi:hypothetical protein
MSKGVEPVLVIRQEIVILPQKKPTITKGVIVAIRVKYMNLNLINRLET